MKNFSCMLGTLACMACASMEAAEVPAVLEPPRKGYVVVTDYVKADGKTDVSDALQELIDSHPNRTLYFPDGVYLLSKPILTPSDPRKSVDLQLSNYAVLKASADWSSPEAIVRLGAKEQKNDIRTNGSNYSFTGGIIDGSNIANGISIDGGRETVIRNVSIKHTKLGLHIKYGANSGSSDADVMNVNIVGTGRRDSVGVLVDGHDNTLSNMRIANVFVGVEVHGGATMLRSIHPLYTSNYEDYTESCGFKNYSAHTRFDFCYSDNFGVAFWEEKGARGFYHECQGWWYSDRAKKQTVFRCMGSFNSIVTNIIVGYRGNDTYKQLLEEREKGGKGEFSHVWTSGGTVNENEHSHEPYMKN